MRMPSRNIVPGGRYRSGMKGTEVDLSRPRPRSRLTKGSPADVRFRKYGSRLFRVTGPNSVGGAGAGHWVQATSILPSLRFPAPLFVIVFRHLGLLHTCLAMYAACSCDHTLVPLETHLLRRARGGERTLSHDCVRDALTTSFVSRARTRIGSAPASFPHRLLGGAEGVYTL